MFWFEFVNNNVKGVILNDTNYKIVDNKGVILVLNFKNLKTTGIKT